MYVCVWLKPFSLEETGVAYPCPSTVARAAIGYVRTAMLGEAVCASHLQVASGALEGLALNSLCDEPSWRKETQYDTEDKNRFYRAKRHGLQAPYEPSAVDVWLEVQLDVEGMAVLSDLGVAFLNAVVALKCDAAPVWEPHVEAEWDSHGLSFAEVGETSNHAHLGAMVEGAVVSDALVVKTLTGKRFTLDGEDAEHAEVFVIDGQDVDGQEDCHGSRRSGGRDLFGSLGGGTGCGRRVHERPGCGGCVLASPGRIGTC